MSDYEQMRPNAVYELLRDQIRWHKFNQGQQGSMSGVNYHKGAEDALRSVIDQLRDKYGTDANKPTDLNKE